MSRKSARRARDGGPPQRRFATRAVAGFGAVLLGAGVLPGLLATPAGAAVGQGFDLNASDLRFILTQIKIAEEHARTATAANPCSTLLGPVGAPAGPNQIPNDNATGHLLPFGLRTVDGSCNNLLAGNEEFGMADLPFPRLAPPNFRDADVAPAGFPGAGADTSYTQTSGSVFDADPRTASNLIVDQTEANPAAVAAAPENAVPDESGTLFIPNVATDEGLSAPFNSWFTLFGQFFDHGLDLTNKGGAGTVFMPLAADDPLYNPAPGARTNFMVLTRATNAPGTRDAINQTSSFIDQSQTYTSHPSHQVFLRQYVTNAAGRPVSDGHMLEGEDGGLATWAATKEQARDVLGIALADQDIFNVPLLATDAYGKFIPGPARGLPQLVMTDGTLVEGNLTTPVTTAGAVPTGHAFLDDIAHNAVPKPAQPAQGPGAPAQPALTADVDTTITGAGAVQPAGTYDDEMLAAHFVAGDGRINENIGLSAVHQVFHSEHNRLVGDIKTTLETETTPEFVAEFKDAAGAGGWNGERLFQAARFVTEMEYQHLAFEEFARKVQPMVNLFGAYDPSINPAISAEFAHSVYRFGHSMLTESVDRVRPDGSRDDIDLFDAFLNPPAYAAGGLTPQQATGNIVRGMTEQVGNEIDEFVTDALRNRLVGLPLDLAALNIARGRDTGIPSLNGARRAFSAQTNGDSALAPYPNWLDFGLGLKHHESLINFVAAYGTHPTITGTMAEKREAAALLVAGDPTVEATPDDAVAFMNGIEHRAPSTFDEVTGEEIPGAVIHSDWVSGPGGVTTTGLDDVDLWVGGLAEAQSPFGGLLGSTMNHVFETDMEDLQDGDRLYYLTRTAGLNLLVQLEGNSFAELISRNSDAEGLPADVFSRPDYKFHLSAQNATGPIVDDPATPDYDETKLLTRAVNGQIRYIGGSHVVVSGSPRNESSLSDLGDDTLRGNDGNDRLEGKAGNDSYIGGEGDDVLTDTFGDDVLKGGPGDDALNSGQGFDLNQSGTGNDFVVGGSDPTETFGGPGNDMIIAGQSADTIFGDDGDDWIEGGAQNDLLQGDNGAPFQDDPNTPGHDVIKGDGGNDDYDAEGGDDIMIAGPGIERSEGILGFDWVTHKTDPTPANADFRFTGLLPDTLDNNRDRFDLVEALSGWTSNDTLRGDDAIDTDLVGHELTAEGIDRITNLRALLPAGTVAFNSGNIIIGGAGADVIEGRGGDDIINGDAWLNVQLRVPNLATTDDLTDTRLVDDMGAVQADVFAGLMDPGSISIVRTIETAAPGADADTAVYSGLLADYDITRTPNGLVVNHIRGAATDGIDTVRNVERLQFSDQTLTVASPTPTAVTATAGVNSATVNWTLPATPGVTSFVVRARTGPDATPTVVQTVPVTPGTARSAVISNLTLVPHTFTVAAVNQFGEGPESAPSAAVTPAANPAPTVTARAPGVDATGVLVGNNITATFSEAVDGVTTTTFAIRPAAAPASAPIAGTVTRNGTTDQWILNPTADLAASTAYTVTLTGGATAIRDLAGAPLATTSWSFTTAAAANPAPTVTARTPLANATGVAVGSNITATFSEAVQGVNGTTFAFRPTSAPTSAPIAGAVSSNVNTWTLDPTADLAANTAYTVTLTGGATAIRDLAGAPLATTSWSFTTAAAANPAPTVTARTPLANATGVPVANDITATFSEDVTGVSGTTFVVRSNAAPGTAIAATVTRVGTTNQWALNPTADLAANTAYTVTLTGGATAIRDLAGAPLATTSWSFTTAAAANPAPTVTARSPLANATGVAVGSNITATFSEAVQGVNGTTFAIRPTSAPTSAPIAGAVSSNVNTWTLDPTADLAANTAYTVTLTGGATAIRDLGNAPLVTTTWSFTTGAAVVNAPPTLTARTPAINATGVAVGDNVTATFSEAVTGVTTATFVLRNAAGQTIVAPVSQNGTTNQWILNPNADLLPGTAYTVTLTGSTTAIRDLANAPFATTSWSFTTAAAPTGAPTVTARSPLANATGVAVGNDITATFSEAVQGVNTTTFAIRPTSAPTSAPIAGSVVYNATTRVATLNPTAALAGGTSYTVTLTGGPAAIRDLQNTALATTTWSFTTVARAPGAPVIGTAVAGVAGGAVTATANWAPPASDGGSPITGYRVRAQRVDPATGASVGTPIASAVQAATARSLEMTLAAGSYRFTVEAINAVATGAQSPVSNVVIAR